MHREAKSLSDINNPPEFKAYSSNGHSLPAHWRYILPKAFQSMALPQETKATCMNCPKIKEGWRPDYRCCTFIPSIPNFSLGLLLKSSNGRHVVQKAKERGLLTPEGLTQSPELYLKFMEDMEADSYGKSQKVLCPMLEPQSGHCGIHQFRNAVCSTFFCINDLGDEAEEFWAALQELVGQVEMALSQWCLEETGYDVKAYMRTYDELAPTVTSLSDRHHHGFRSAVLQKLWGPYFGKEEEFYLACADVVVGNRERLWQIACDTPILDSKIFNHHLLKSIPESLAHHIDPEEWQTDYAPSLPMDLWIHLQDVHANLSQSLAID